MPFYSLETTISLCSVGLFFVLSIYLYFVTDNKKAALVILIIGGFLMRLLFSNLDPFLYEWDERFHALVAKNLIQHPFKPMLRVSPIIPYEMKAWCCNHVWVHKQPLFLWQMALSLKVFGINEIAMRIPSVILGTISIFLTYDIARLWIKNNDIAYVSALLFSVSYYQLELTSGRFGLDHNDIAFAFYITASFWAFLKYIHSNFKIKWSILIGVLVGLAVLNKWLTGILIFGGWGLYVLLSSSLRNKVKYWFHISLALIFCLLVFLPWQIYIFENFPAETLLMHKSNLDHFFQDFKHPGTIWFHFRYMKTLYGPALLVFLPFGIINLLFYNNDNKNITLSFLAMTVVIYAFFSFIVVTKMPAFTFPVNSLIWILISSGIIFAISWVKKYIGIRKVRFLLFVGVSLLSLYTLNIFQVINYRSENNNWRNNKIHNTNVYKSINLECELNNKVIINCKNFEDVEMMFFRNVNAYHWFPKEREIDSLISLGYEFAAFKSHNAQILPDYIECNEQIQIIDLELK